jgi:CheY-like chemotaxis protein
VNELLIHLLDMLRRLLSEDVQLEYPTSHDPLWVEADTVMVEQVVTNLCLNAQDAMAPKGGRLLIDARLMEINSKATAMNPEAAPGSFACISVTDSGSGMNAATLERIFEPFFTTKDVGKGTGLGLSTVYGIVKEHRGWVEVTSEIGTGSTFRVYIPTWAKAPANGAEAPARDARRGTETILLVDDEKSIRTIVALGLRNYGYRVLEASNGPEAVKVWDDRAGEIDLLFSDMKMPGGLTGMDLFERFKRTKPTLKGVISSGYSSEDFLKSRESIGRDLAFLAKPYNVRPLAATVRNCLDQEGPRRWSADSDD